MVRQEFTLNPFGSGTIKQTLHQGHMFTLYLAELCGREVCLKTPVIFPRGGFSQSEYYCHRFSETFWGGHTWNPELETIDGLRSSLTPEDRLQIAMGMLAIENQIVQSTEGAWNHSIIGQGVWDGLSGYPNQRYSSELPTEDESNARLFCARFMPVLVMPYHRATRLGDLPKIEQRKLFPRMLPALWSALSHTYHGDLSETNILVQPDYTQFHLIDPGIMLASIGTCASNTFFGDDYFSSILTTNAANYPLLPPFNNAVANNINNQSANALVNLQDYLRELSKKREHEFIDMPAADYGIFNLDHPTPQWKYGERSCISLSRIPWPSGEATKHQSSPQTRPFPSDLLALGIIYYRILTNEDLFLGREILPDRPAWQGDLPSGLMDPQDGSIFETYRRVANTLSENYIARELDKHSLDPMENRLANALLNLQIRDRNHTLELTRML